MRRAELPLIARVGLAVDEAVQVNSVKSLACFAV